ncbi:MAG: hypothetical protein E7536_03325 [Ruminococcaceae bacterium]|nr:hypothetical protein [Oscillospiraceae bacterium]
MERKIETKKMLKSLKRNEAVLGAKIPMGYSYGLPILQVCNDVPCLVVPFVKYKMTGRPDKTLIYPIICTFTIDAVNDKVVGFEDLRYNKKFRKVNFNDPIGYFRPEKLKNVNKAQYNEMRDELFYLYDKMIDALADGAEYNEADEARMGELLSTLVEPCLYPIYKALDAGFYATYLK